MMTTRYMRMSILAIGIAALAGGPLKALAADASRLGADLTPSGAEKGPNKDGTIPAWPGNEVQHSGWTFGKLRGDHWKYKGEKPMLSIDASNVDMHSDKLSKGQVALIKQIKGYRMDVYPSHRSCGIPAFVAENTKKNVTQAKMAPDGWRLQEAVVPGFPFPMPQNGAEAMLNMKLRYRGVGLEFKNIITSVSPRKGSSDWIKAISIQTNYYPWGAVGSTPLSTIPRVESYLYYAYTEPVALAGQAMIQTLFFDQPDAEVFYYFPGQRRVRRMPSYAYDSPLIGYENQYLQDEPAVFQGTIDRFDWKLVGKKEMYVPYNSFGAYNFSAKFEDVAKRDFVDAASRRYELHRVYVVEASVKQGSRHVAPKRTYYLDEDSWNPVLAEDYDGQGKLSKVREGFLIPVYETGTCDVSGFAQFNLIDGRYVFDIHAAGTGVDIRWLTTPDGPRFKSNFYTSDNLRANSER